MDWNNLWNGVADSPGPPLAVIAGESGKVRSNNESTEIPGSHKTSLCRVSEGCKQAIRATFSLPKVAHARQVSFRSDDPVAGRTEFFLCQLTFAHKHWAGTGVLHAGSIPAQPFILTLILIAMPRDIEQDLAINCTALMLCLGTIVHLVELYFSKT